MHPESTLALQAIQKKAGKKRRVVFVSGNFNVLHPGHLRMLNFAAGCGDLLVVGVHSDGTAGTLVPADLRLESVGALGVVDHAFVLHDPPEEFISALKPVTVVKGKEHEGAHNP